MRQNDFATYHVELQEHGHGQTAPLGPLPLVQLTFHAVRLTEVRVPSYMNSTNEDIFLDYSEEWAPSETHVLMIPGGAWIPKHRSYIACYMSQVLGIPIEATRKALRQVSPPPRGNVSSSIFINYEIISTRCYDYDEGPEFFQFTWEWIMHNLRSSHHRSFAADKSAVEALEKFKFKSGSGGCGCGRGYDVSDGQCQCAICLNDFEDGVELTKMPCSHAFHTDCLTRWLQINHVCALCRFPIPRSDFV